MKKLLYIFVLIIFFACSKYSYAQIDNTNVNQVFKIDINTLKYEQKQLVYAIITGDEKSVRMILNSDPEPKTTYAKIPLTMFAIHANETEILKMLIEEYDFDKNQSYLGVTPIEIAIYLKRYDSIKYLLSINVELSQDDLKYIKKSKNKKLKELFSNQLS